MRERASTEPVFVPVVLPVAMTGSQLGSMCGVIPRRVGVLVVAVMTVVIGAAVSLFIIWKALQATLRYHPTIGCDGAGGEDCAPQIYDVFTCKHTSRWTAEVLTWYVAVGMTTSGYIGVRGVMEREKSTLVWFAVAYLVQGILIIIIGIVDAFYVEICGHLPDSSLHLLYGLVPERMNVLYKLGHDPANAPPADLQHVLGSFAMALIPISRVLGALWSFYIAQQAYTLAHIAAGGPCGLGPMYGIDVGSDLHREWKHCVDDLMESRQALVREGAIKDCLPISNLNKAGVAPPVAQHGIDYVRQGSLYVDDYRGYGTMA